MFLKLSKICGFSAAILNFRYNKAWWDVDTYFIEKGVPENMGVAVGISSLGGIELEIPLGVFYPLPLVINGWQKPWPYEG